MTNLRGTRTEKNLINTFASEYKVQNRHTKVAIAARRKGYEQLAAIFEDTAGHEKNYAKIWYKLLCGSNEHINDGAKGAAGGYVKNVCAMSHRHMAVEARDEGFKNIALLFDTIDADCNGNEHIRQVAAPRKSNKNFSVFGVKTKSA